jgi:hypothetical protein
MRDPQKWNLAMSRFNGFYANIPPWLKAEQIADYHSIVSALEEASGQDGHSPSKLRVNML